MTLPTAVGSSLNLMNLTSLGQSTTLLASSQSSPTTDLNTLPANSFAPAVSTSTLHDFDSTAATTTHSLVRLMGDDAVADTSPVGATEPTNHSRSRLPLAVTAMIAGALALTLPTEALAQNLSTDPAAMSDVSGGFVFQDFLNLSLFYGALYAIPILRGAAQMARFTGRALHKVFINGDAKPQAADPTQDGVESTIYREQPKQAAVPQNNTQATYQYPRWIEALNNATGWTERIVAPIRDMAMPLITWKNLFIPAFPLSWAMYCQLSGGASLISTLAPTLGAIYLANLNRNYRIRDVDRKVVGLSEEGPLTASAFERHRTRPLGVLGPEVPLRDTIGEEEFFTMGQQIYADTPQRGRWRSFKALVNTIRFAWIYSNQAKDISGSGAYLTDLWRYRIRGKVAPVNQELIETGSIITEQWGIQSAAINRTNLDFVNQERLQVIPEGSQVIFIGNHDGSMFPTFWGAFQMRRAAKGIHGRPLADHYNFSGRMALRWIPGLSSLMLALQNIGLFYASRNEKCADSEPPKGIFKRTLQQIKRPFSWAARATARAMVNRGLLAPHKPFDWTTDFKEKADLSLSAVAYTSKGREPKSVDEANKLIQATPLTQVVSTRRPKFFVARGVGDQVTELARASGEAVYVVYLKTTGAYAVVPKADSSLGQMAEPAITDQTIRYSIESIGKVNPEDTADETALNWEHMTLVSNNTSQVLVGHFAAIAQKYRENDAQQLIRTFTERAERELLEREAIAQNVSAIEALKKYPTYYTVMARILAVPHHVMAGEISQRRAFQNRFFQLLQAEHNEDALHALLKEISLVVKHWDYKKPSYNIPTTDLNATRRAPASPELISLLEETHQRIRQELGLPEDSFYEEAFTESGERPADELDNVRFLDRASSAE